MAGNIVPRTDGGSNLGTADKEFNVIYAKSFGGTIASQVVTTNSPTFTGTPAAPTAAAGTNTTQIATTAFANAAASAAASSAVSTHNLASDAHSATIAAAVNTHNAATDAHSTEFAKYLPLSGGAMTSRGNTQKICRIGLDDDSSDFQLGAWTYHGNSCDGAYLNLFGKNFNNDYYKGNFELCATVSPTDRCALNGSHNGTLTWAGNEVERVVASGDGYIRYASGLQMCWVLDLAFSTTGTWTFPVAFITRPTVTFHAFGGGEYMDVVVGVTFSTEWATFKPTRGNNISTLAPYSVEGIAIGRWK